MQKILTMLVLSFSWLFSFTIFQPIMTIEVNGTSKDMVLSKNELVIGTDNGLLQVYDYEQKKFIKEIKLPKVKDFMGDEVPPRVFSVDKMLEQYLLLSDSGKGGYVNLWVEEKGLLKQLLDSSHKMAAIKARFINSEHILLGLLSNEAVLFNTKTKKEVFRVQLSPSKFSDFALNNDKSQVVFACESGILNIIDTKSGKTIKVLKGVNVDNVYKVDFKNDVISGAGQDRRASIYSSTTGMGTYIEGSFLIYATGLSPSRKRVAYAMDEQNNISIYERDTKVKVAELQGQKSTLNNILFKDENILFSSSDDNKVLMWNLKIKGKTK